MNGIPIWNMPLMKLQKIRIISERYVIITIILIQIHGLDITAFRIWEAKKSMRSEMLYAIWDFPHQPDLLMTADILLFPKCFWE